MRKVLAALIFGASLLSAQILVPFPFPSFPPGLKTYLELTDDQVSKIDALNASLRTLQSTKVQRQAQVQLEIAQETAKEALDPMALGVRYLELEAIRRELVAAQQKTVTDVQALLTPAQKTKLTALQDAMRLASTGCDAMAQHLLPPASLSAQLGTIPLPANVIPVGVLSPTPVVSASYASFLLGSSGCSTGGLIAAQP